MAKCPFLSRIVLSHIDFSERTFPDHGYESTSINHVIQYTDCIGANCQLWDFENNRCGLVKKSPPTPYATSLLSEFMAGQDGDGNNKIYGVDFKVADSSNKPPMLNQIEKSPEWKEPPLIVDWADLLAWYLSKDGVPPLPSPTFSSNPDYGG